MLTACSKMAVYTSKWEDNVNEDEIYNGYDKSSQIRWMVSNNSTHLVLRFDTENKASQLKILRKGLKIYIDTLGKKKEDIFINYPLASNAKSNRSTMPQRTRGQGGQKKKRSFNVSRMVEKVSKEARFQYGGEEELFNVMVNSSDFDVSLEADSENELSYMVSIPFDRITKKNIYDIQNWSIGIVSGAFEIPVQKSGGGMKGGGAGGRGGGAMRSSSGMEMSDMVEPIKIWFQVKLSKGN